MPFGVDKGDKKLRVKGLILIILVLLTTACLGIFNSEIYQTVREHSFLSDLFYYETDEQNVDEERKPIEYMYITILDKDSDDKYTFQEMNQVSQEESIEAEPRLPAHWLIGNDLGPKEGELAEPTLPVNATIEQRGNSVRRSDLKSYKIRLENGAELWNGKSIINLNKHPFDHTRVRNKLTFDYVKLIPDLVSMDTQFVRLYVKDLTAVPQAEEFVDYGLFTHVEQPSKNFRRKNGLDEDGYLYKAIDFEFHRYPDKLKNQNDPEFNKSDFDSVLRIKGREYHEKLLTMLDDVNNEALDFDDVFHTYFDQDNFLTWIAVNLLIGNLDTSGNNFYLYSSRYSDKWEFIPWDYDKAWNYDWHWERDPTSIHPTREGLSLYWGWPLAKRYFRNQDHVQALNEKMDEILAIMTEEQTMKFLDEYKPIVKPLIMQQPDVKLLPEDLDRFDQEYEWLAQVPQENFKKYKKNIEKPMPVFMGGPWIEGDQMTFTWDESYDLQGDEIYYDLSVSESPEFTSLVHQEEGLQETQWTMELLPQGEYYWKVIISDGEGHEQIAFESFVSDSGRFYHGVKQFSLE